MGKTVFITGGSRSGKSSYAQRLAEGLEAPRLYLATCPVRDEEMRERVRRHQRSRKGLQWKTVEEEKQIEKVIDHAADYNVILVDCLTLWVSNLMWEAQQTGVPFSEDAMEERARALAIACGGLDGTVILVTNEVGWGVVPENPVARHYRDIAGRCNQILAAESDAVVLLVSGLPMILKDVGSVIENLKED